MKKYLNVILLVAIHKAAEGIHADADPSVTFNRKSARMERQAPSKSPFTVIIMADAEELLHLNKQWSTERRGEWQSSGAATQQQEEEFRTSNRAGGSRPSPHVNYQYQIIGNHLQPIAAHLNKRIQNGPVKPSTAAKEEESNVRSLLDLLHNFQKS